MWYLWNKCNLCLHCPSCSSFADGSNIRSWSLKQTTRYKPLQCLIVDVESVQVPSTDISYLELGDMIPCSRHTQIIDNVITCNYEYHTCNSSKSPGGDSFQRMKSCEWPPYISDNRIPPLLVARMCKLWQERVPHDTLTLNYSAESKKQGSINIDLAVSTSNHRLFMLSHGFRFIFPLCIFVTDWLILRNHCQASNSMHGQIAFLYSS